MTDIKDRVDQWLRDAHAMEEQAETMLNGQAMRIENYPTLKARIEQHLEETKRQRARLEACIERRGASSSGIKDMAMKFTAMMQNLSGVFAGDEVVKGVLASYTFEHMEIASYRILVAAAEADGDMETARVCEEICAEEEAMAAWLEENMGEIAIQHLVRQEASLEEAKR
ncbi:MULTISPECIES: ferritin-like domain-containing protein [unclassified Aminobacter]|uniref:YciE/YciF ferroxidase family protein n=1 Tax=unclassified Aminobacter TaxID=2644704 RepID=UPI0004667B9E|nr:MULTISPECIES: ferritin-like domain-containing protein [unclassified Aminobacter]TWH34498.1 ferritin-like metal-binding protein YciE [Aminobacter sp. J15]